ncbi:hypothetical protein AB1L88_06185 [Tautonia sp. JC769]|uniref:hypothetical protein n=1 Tax=Tautonia sp. JC769 TaxID=3232135 RepID=UPI0034597B33
MTKRATIEAIAKLSHFDIDEDDDVAIAHDVIASFGTVRRERDAHGRSVRFLHGCLRRYLWAWEDLGCEPPGPRAAFEAVATWLETGAFTADFAERCLPVTPIRDGQPVEDCDEPALSDLSGASARLAYFCKTRNPMDAAMVLVGLFWADAEGLRADDGAGFCEWLSTEGVRIAWPEENGG